MKTTFKLGQIVEAEVTRITDFGAFVKINGQGLGLIHISQISDNFVQDVKQHLNVGDKVKARIIKFGPGKKIDLSLKSPVLLRAQKNNSGFRSSDLEQKLKEFLQQSSR